ncbi:hypothetical protein HAX54_048775, partial [Datura stramonium]|nr:hypothetical protein [Datura stramonium]
ENWLCVLDLLKAEKWLNGQSDEPWDEPLVFATSQTKRNRGTPPAKPSIEEHLVLELKELLYYFWYVFLGARNTLLVMVTTNLEE